MKEIIATVVYPVDIRISVDDNATLDQIWAKVIQAADEGLPNSAPAIHSCSEPGLEKLEPAPIKEEGQADVYMLTLASLREARLAIAPALNSSAFWNGVKNKKLVILGESIKSISANIDNLISDIVAVMSPK